MSKILSADKFLFPTLSNEMMIEYMRLQAYCNSIMGWKRPFLLPENIPPFVSK